MDRWNMIAWLFDSVLIRIRSTSAAESARLLSSSKIDIEGPVLIGEESLIQYVIYLSPDMGLPCTRVMISADLHPTGSDYLCRNYLEPG